MNNKAQGKVRCPVCRKWFKKRGLSKHMRFHDQKVMEPILLAGSGEKIVRRILTEDERYSLCKSGELLLKIAETCPNATTAMALKYIILRMNKVLKFVEGHEV